VKALEEKVAQSYLYLVILILTQLTFNVYLSSSMICLSFNTVEHIWGPHDYKLYQITLTAASFALFSCF